MGIVGVQGDDHTGADIVGMYIKNKLSSGALRYFVYSDWQV